MRAHTIYVADDGSQHETPGGAIERDTILADSGSPFSAAWGRLGCIDGLNREWGQAYYSMYPERGEIFELTGEG